MDKKNPRTDNSPGVYRVTYPFLQLWNHLHLFIESEEKSRGVLRSKSYYRNKPITINITKLIRFKVNMYHMS